MKFPIDLDYDLRALEQLRAKGIIHQKALAPPQLKSVEIVLNLLGIDKLFHFKKLFKCY